MIYENENQPETSDDDINDDLEQGYDTFKSTPRNESMIAKKKRLKKKIQQLIDEFSEEETETMTLRSGSSIGKYIKVFDFPNH